MDTSTAKSQVSALARMFKSVIDMADFLEASSQIEAKTAEALERKKDLDREIEEISKQVASSKKDIEYAKKQSDLIIEAANAEGEKIVSEHKEKAVKLSESAEVLLNNAMKKAKEIIEEAKKKKIFEMSRYDAKIKEIDGLVKERQEQLLAISKDVQEKQIKHDSLSTKIKETLESFKE